MHQIEQLMGGEIISEEEVKAICEKAKVGRVQAWTQVERAPGFFLNKNFST